MSFDDLGLGPDVLRAVADAGYDTPTPIQEQAIPQILMGRDVIGLAQTGTGKTASFTLPMIEILGSGRARARMPRSLILTPTRELAAQVSENFEIYGKHHKLTMALLIGGVSFVDQVQKLDRGVDVLIATPGRLLDHFERGKVLLADIKILVIDEADRMLDMGFIPDIERIINLLPRIRQTLMTSATMPKEIRRLADTYLMNPREISVAPPTSPTELVTQGLLMAPTDPKGKRLALRNLLEAENVKNAIIFCNRKRDVSVLQRSLARHGYNAAAIHGDLPQVVRTETLDKFRKGELQYLVASDVAARGLDIVAMSHVFNFDVPYHPEDYIHRIGRTGRAGLEGRAFTLSTPADSRSLAAIERLIGKKIPRVGATAPRAGAVEEPAATPAPKERRRPRRERAEKREEPRRTEQREEPRRAEKRETREEPRRAEKREPREEARRGPKREARDDSRRGPKREDRKPASRSNGAKGKPRRRPDDEPEEVGLGDHVPAFLLR